MIRQPALIAAALLTALPAVRQATAHCQVPCGIYGDERRFEEMLEDAQTIAKAIGEIDTLAGTHDATGHNQLARWVSAKEAHATNVQEIIGQYFLAQRIKPDSDNYTEQLKAAHGVIIAAMKCKQAADPATATTLEKAILNLYRAYEGKEPQFGQLVPGGTTPASAPAAGHSHEHGEHAHDDHGHERHDHQHEVE